MIAAKRVEDYTSEQINGGKKLIEILVGIPENKQALFTAITTAYIDGVKTGTCIAKDLEEAIV